MQALETVPGINQVSEGHAAVPAIRGMARGRVLLLVDGARVTSERRVGPSATFLDPAVVEGIDVARGPGSVAYGSDALGGVISVRTRNAEPGSPLRVGGTALFGGGARSTGAVELQGVPVGGLLVEGHARCRRLEQPEDDTDIFNWRRTAGSSCGAADRPGVLTAGRATSAATSSARATTRARSVHYPTEDCTVST
jgi:hypothetical protein